MRITIVMVFKSHPGPDARQAGAVLASIKNRKKQIDVEFLKLARFRRSQSDRDLSAQTHPSDDDDWRNYLRCIPNVVEQILDSLRKNQSNGSCIFGTNGRDRVEAASRKSVR